MKQSPRILFLAIGSILLPIGLHPPASGSELSSTQKGVQPREVVLNNGLTLLMVERHDEPTVAVGVFYDVGGVNDPRGKSGIAHMFEHMLFKGSRIIGTNDYEAECSLIEQQDILRAKMIDQMNQMRIMKRHGLIDDVLDPKQWTPEYTSLKKQYDVLLDAQREFIKDNELFNLYTTNGGARVNAGTMADTTLYFVQLPANKIELFFWLESDRMVNGVMREFYIERENVREERRLRTESTPTGKYNEAFEALFWQSHPYGIPVIGWPSEVESITRDDVREFYKVHYAPDNARIVLVGDFDSDKIVGMANRYFGHLPRGAKKPPLIITEEPKPISVRRLNAEADTNPSVRVRFHTVAIGHKDEAALDVLSGLLSGKTGRLYKRLITQDEAAIGRPRATQRSQKYAGYFAINVTVKENRTPEEVEQIVLEEIEIIRDGEITDHELQRVKNQVLASSVRRLKSNFGLMFQLGLYDTWYDWTYINESPKRMLAVSSDDVKKVLNKYFDANTRTVAIYRTKKRADKKVEDSELDQVLMKIPAEQRPQTRIMIQKLSKQEDIERLSQMLAIFEEKVAGGEITEDRRVVTEYLIKVIQDRLDELQALAKEAD